MKADQENKNGAETEKSVDNTDKKANTIAVAFLVGVISILFLQNIFDVSIFLLSMILYVTLILCISAIIFCFVKQRAWLYRVIAAGMSSIACIGFYRTLRIDVWGFYPPDFVVTILNAFPDEMVNPVYELILGTVSLFFAAVIFAAALLVQYIYKRIKNKRTSIS